MITVVMEQFVRAGKPKNAERTSLSASLQIAVLVDEPFALETIG
jgi:hypothetical protein